MVHLQDILSIARTPTNFDWSGGLFALSKGYRHAEELVFSGYDDWIVDTFMDSEQVLESVVHTPIVDFWSGFEDSLQYE